MTMSYMPSKAINQQIKSFASAKNLDQPLPLAVDCANRNSCKPFPDCLNSLTNPNDTSLPFRILQSANLHNRKI